jgi:hypothetical protein
MTFGLINCLNEKSKRAWRKLIFLKNGTFFNTVARERFPSIWTLVSDSAQLTQNLASLSLDVPQFVQNISYPLPHFGGSADGFDIGDFPAAVLSL